MKLAIARFEKDTLSVVEARGKKGIFRIAHKPLLIRPFFKAEIIPSPLGFHFGELIVTTI